MDYLKKTLEKAHMYDNLIENVNAVQKHAKGYLYDSLCLRYKIARMGCLEKETNDLMDRLDESPSVAYKKALKNADRDCLRFYELLDEAMGEHD